MDLRDDTQGVVSHVSNMQGQRRAGMGGTRLDKVEMDGGAIAENNVHTAIAKTMARQQ